MNYDKLSLCGAAAAIRNGQISASELNRHCLEVAKKTAGLNAFVVIDEQYVLEQAAKRCILFLFPFWRIHDEGGAFNGL